MLMAELKERWGTYCDTDKLVTDTMATLNKYHHKCTEYGVCEMLDTYFENKKHLIEMFEDSQHYIGNMRICIDIELERGMDQNEIRTFCENFPTSVNASSAVWKFTDENGKTLADYSKVGLKKFKARQLCYGNVTNQMLENAENRKKFRCDGVTVKSAVEYDRFLSSVYDFGRNNGPKLASETVSMLDRRETNISFAEGMKTSRAFNRLCSAYGVDKLPNYNKQFAEYADMVSGLKRKLKFYISLNPLDYLTMSFGRSWSSCHTIDKINERNMPNSYSGMHCGGTMSYMLDSTSIITYVHSHATENPEEGKIYRNMFHFDNGTLIQGRLYPQGNDGATDLYKVYRRFVQVEFTDLLGLNADEWIKKTCNAGENTASTGVHYPDYTQFDGCNVSYPKEMPNAASNVVPIGHNRICPYCGEVVSNSEDSGYLNHRNCR